MTRQIPAFFLVFLKSPEFQHHFNGDNVKIQFTCKTLIFCAGRDNLPSEPLKTLNRCLNSASTPSISEHLLANFSRPSAASSRVVSFLEYKLAANRNRKLLVNTHDGEETGTITFSFQIFLIPNSSEISV